MNSKIRVAFICLGNSCRSIMAEALARHFWGERASAVSAGLNPLGYVAAETLEVLAEMGVPTAGLYSKGLAELDLKDLHIMVNLTDYSLPRMLPPALRVIQRPVRDPYGFGLESYRRSRDDILRLIRQEGEQWLAQSLGMRVKKP